MDIVSKVLNWIFGEPKPKPKPKRVCDYPHCPKCGSFVRKGSGCGRCKPPEKPHAETPADTGGYTSTPPTTQGQA